MPRLFIAGAFLGAQIALVVASLNPSGLARVIATFRVVTWFLRA
jgi:hypothetical protein